MMLRMQPKDSDVYADATQTPHQMLTRIVRSFHTPTDQQLHAAFFHSRPPRVRWKKFDGLSQNLTSAQCSWSTRERTYIQLRLRDRGADGLSGVVEALRLLGEVLLGHAHAVHGGGGEEGEAGGHGGELDGGRHCDGDVVFGG